MSATKKAKLNAIMIPVLDDTLTQSTPLVEVYTGNILDSKSTSKIITELNSLLPVPELNHLKRVKGRSVLLFPRGLCEENKVVDYLKGCGFNTDMISNEVSVAEVAKIPPRTKKQHGEVQKLWPCNFHSDKYLEKLCTNQLFTEEENKFHIRVMEFCLELARFGKRKKVGAVVVNPKINSIVACGYDQTEDNPSKHAVMVAIDYVSATQNGSAWIKNLKKTQCHSGLDLRGIPSEVGDLIKNFDDLKFGASKYKGKSEIQDPADGPYLCTNYYVYTTREPCVMCAMGLIHSRAKRVFYGASAEKGGLGTLCKVHTVKDLNHHYEVFKGLLENDCINL